jgi:hypothetical protein
LTRHWKSFCDKPSDFQFCQSTLNCLINSLQGLLKSALAKDKVREEFRSADEALKPLLTSRWKKCTKKKAPNTEAMSICASRSQSSQSRPSLRLPEYAPVERRPRQSPVGLFKRQRSVSPPHRSQIARFTRGSSARPDVRRRPVKVQRSVPAPDRDSDPAAKPQSLDSSRNGASEGNERTSPRPAPGPAADSPTLGDSTGNATDLRNAPKPSNDEAGFYSESCSRSEPAGTPTKSGSAGQEPA